MRIQPGDQAAILDSLYGVLQFPPQIADLASRPLVQRLRHVRLSNIDSLAMPGISNISRYEHSIGAVHLALQATFGNQLDLDDRLALLAAVLVHDTAITPFGHLAEEALQYAALDYDHETRWSLLLGEAGGIEPGGVDLQIYHGRVSGLREWAYSTFSADVNDRLKQILTAIKGEGVLGKCVAGALDFDNLDNVTRIGYHMGLTQDTHLPVRISQNIIGCDETVGPIYGVGAVHDIQSWQQLRRNVYNHLMLSPTDFVGKIMLLSAAIDTYERGLLAAVDWKLTDHEFINRIMANEDRHTRETVMRWQLGDLWPCSNLIWMNGIAPSFSATRAYAGYLQEQLKRPCFAYRIKDKRERPVTVALVSGDRKVLGIDPKKWVLGIASPSGRPFSLKEEAIIKNTACEYFKTEYLGLAGESEPTTLLFGNN